MVLINPSLFAEESFIPKPPSLNASNYILMDSMSGRVLAESGADEKIEPASITKVMTGYVAVDQIQQGYVNLSDEVYISENCWKKGGEKNKRARKKLTSNPQRHNTFVKFEASEYCSNRISKSKRCYYSFRSKYWFH